MPVLLDRSRIRGAETSAPPPPGVALVALSLSILLASLGTSGANVALPTFANVFGASFQAVQWIVLAYLLAVTTMIVGAGRLGDMIGRRRLLRLGIALFASASLVSGLAPSLAVLIAARAVQGTGAAVMMSLSMAFVSDAVPRERVGRAMGLLGTMSAIGTALGPSLGGMLLTFPGWRALFLINVPLGLAALWLVHRALPERRAKHSDHRSFDVAGTALLAVSLGAFALALTVNRQRLEWINVALLASAALGMIGFVRRQSRARVPLVPLSLLRDRALAKSLASNALVACVMMSTLIVGPFYLTRALGLASAAMGLAMTVGPILTAVAGVPAGRFVDARGPGRVAQVGLLGMLVGSVLLAALPRHLGVGGYLGSVFFLTIGYALFQAANNTAVMATAPSDDRGLVAGVLSLSRNLGLITGASLMGAVFALASGVANITTGNPDAVAHGMRVTFAVAAVLISVPITFTASRRAGGAVAASIAVLAFASIRAGAQVRLPSERPTDVPAAIAVVRRAPYPAAAAGWGPQIGRDLFMSRWAEDWAARVRSARSGRGAHPRWRARRRLHASRNDAALLTPRGSTYQIILTQTRK